MYLCLSEKNGILVIDLGMDMTPRSRHWIMFRVVVSANNDNHFSVNIQPPHAYLSSLPSEDYNYMLFASATEFVFHEPVLNCSVQNETS